MASAEGEETEKDGGENSGNPSHLRLSPNQSGLHPHWVYIRRHGGRVARRPPRPLCALVTALLALSQYSQTRAASGSGGFSALSPALLALLPALHPCSPSSPRGRPSRCRPHPHELPWLSLPAIRCPRFAPCATKHPHDRVSALPVQWRTPDTPQTFRIDQVLPRAPTLIFIRMDIKALLLVSRRSQSEHPFPSLFSSRACNVPQETFPAAISPTLRLFNREVQPVQTWRRVSRFAPPRLFAHHLPVLERSSGCLAPLHETIQPSALTRCSGRRCGRRQLG